MIKSVKVRTSLLQKMCLFFCEPFNNRENNRITPYIQTSCNKINMRTSF
jgi:hypothetical protein